MKIFILCLSLTGLLYSGDLDTTTIEKLQIEFNYEFGFPIRDTIYSTTHIYRENYKNWYIRGLNSVDYVSDRQPIVLDSTKRYFWK